MYFQILLASRRPDLIISGNFLTTQILQLLAVLITRTSIVTIKLALGSSTCTIHNRAYFTALNNSINSVLYIRLSFTKPLLIYIFFLL